MEFKIYLPTLGRVNNQVTLRCLPLDLQRKVTLVLHKDEVKFFKERGVVAELLTCSAQGKGIGPVRDWILDHAKKTGVKRFCMVDDDIRLQKRRDEQGLKKGPGGREFYSFTAASHEEYREAFKWVDEALKKHAHASWGTRFLDIASAATEIYGGRALGVLGYNVKLVTQVKARFMKGLEGTAGGMEDNNMTLQLLRAGLPNAISMVYRASPAGSNTKGGCSMWRTADSTKEQAKRIVKAHAPFAKLRVKQTKWEGIDGEQYDTTIYWQKALKEGSKR